MRKSFVPVVAIAAALLLVGGLYIARASDSPGPPPGVAADHWYPIAADLGVAVDEVAVPGRFSQEHIRPLLPTVGAEGRLFARVNGSWVPVYLKTQPQGVYPAR